MAKVLPTEDLEQILTEAREVFSALRDARLFITGGSGFFGYWLLESLLHANRKLSLNVRATLLTRDANAFRLRAPQITNDAAITLLEGDVKSFEFPGEPHTHIIHGATDSGGKQSLQPHLALAESILDGTRRTLQFAIATGARRFLYVSSGAVYGRDVTAVSHIPETLSSAPDPLQLVSSHDEAKRMAEQLCIAYAEGTTLQPIIARCFSFIGPHLPLDTHFAIGNFIGAAITGRPIEIRGDGTPYRSWLYMSDLAEWLWTLLVNGQSHRAYNVGSDEDYSISAAAKLVAQILRPNGKGGLALPINIHGVAEPAALANRYVPSIERAGREMQLKVRVPLPEAIRRTARWHGFPADEGRL